MGDETFDLFCMECNILVQAKIIAQGFGGYQTSELIHSDFEDTEYLGDDYSICVCPICNRPFLVRESRYNLLSGHETFKNLQLLYPSESKIPIEHLPEKIQSTYEQAIRSFKAVLYEPCVIMCRKCLEITCKSFGISERNIYEGLQKLYDEGHIDSRLLNIAHEIRLIGNEAAHGGDDEITKDDARDVLDFTEAILLYLFLLGRRLELLKERRNR